MFGGFVVTFWARHDRAYPRCKRVAADCGYPVWLGEIMRRVLKEMGR